MILLETSRDHLILFIKHHMQACGIRIIKSINMAREFLTTKDNLTMESLIYLSNNIC